MQLSHYPYKLGSGEMYKVIYLEPLKPTIKTSLVKEEWLVNYFSSDKNTRLIPKGYCVQPNGVGSHIYLLSLCFNRNRNKS